MTLFSVVLPLSLATLATFPHPTLAQSSGCGKSNSIGIPGETITWTTTYKGVDYDQLLTLPSSYTGETPVPLQIHHHGWGSSSSECGSACAVKAPEHGFAAISVQGIGKPGWASWNGSGSVASPGSRGATCQTNANDYCNDYPECGSCADNCYWTTCEDSVQYVSEVLDSLEEELCLDLDMIWASGCSNGGIFLYELARDSRMSDTLAGIVPLVGVPHNGFNFGPSHFMHYLGMFGTSDTTVPALTPTNTNQPDVNVDTSSKPGGWYYQTARSTTDLWGECMGASDRENTTEWNIGSYSGLECTKRSASVEGSVAPGSGSNTVDVVECVFKGGHVCNLNKQWGPAYEFMSAHKRVEKVAYCPPPDVPTPSTCAGRGFSCAENTECCSDKCRKGGTCS